MSITQHRLDNTTFTAEGRRVVIGFRGMSGRECYPGWNPASNI